MANAASTIEIELEIRDAINRLGKLEGELKKSSSAMDRVANSTRKMESAFKSARNAASALVAAISVQQIAQAADTFTNFANQIRIATNSAAEAAAVQKELYRVSQTTGTAIEDTTKLYARLRVAADQLGSSQAETIRITEIVAKSLAAAGTSSTEASGALLQLAQALNSPKVQAEEFNSLIDGMPNLLKEVEKQLGLTAGSLKKFVTDGNLTNQLFKDAILGSAEAINEQFGAAQDTIGTATQRINNSLTMLIGKFEQSTGIFNKTANALTKLATEFDKADNIVRQFSEVVVMLGVYFDKLKQLALALTKPLRDAFSVFSGGTSNPIAKTINYIQYSLSLLTVAVDYQTQNLAIRLERLAYQIRDFFIGMVANLLSFFESVDNFFINQINKVIGYYNSAADSIGMDGDVAPIATSTSARESELKFERDSAEFLADSYRRQADLLRQAEEAYTAVNAEFNQYTQQIDSGTLIKTEEQLGNVNLEAANAASSVEKLKEKIEEVKEIEYTDFTGQISEAQQEEFTRQLEEQFRIRTELGQLTEDQQNRFTQGLEEEFERVTEINALTQQKNDLYEASLFPKARELTYLEEATEQLRTQLLLQGQLNEEAERTAGAIVSGISGAGPNASRAINIAQSKSPEEAAAKLILSNEKVAKAIDSSFELLFEVLDPFIDLLGDLISAINRLIGALIENATNAAEGLLDTVGLGPNGYIFGGGLARDLEAAFSSSRPGGPTNQQKAFAQADLIFENIADAPSTRDQLQPKIDELADLIPDLGLTEVINRITQNTEEAVASLEAVQEINFKTLAAASSAPYLMNQIGKEIKKVNQKIAETEEKSKIVIQGLIEAYIQEPLNALDDLTQSAQDQIDAIDFQNMSIEEQIEFRYQESIATIEQQKALADLIDDEDLRTQLLNAANKAEAKTIELKNKQLDQLEREQQLLALQNVETGLQALLSDFERTIEKIDELVQGLFDQVQELLFSDFSPLGPQEQFAQAQSTYESLLENAFDADATEEDIKLLQAFVNEYLTAARNVFKSSTAFTTIFEGVLGDLTGLGLQTSVNAPIQASSNLSSDLEEILSVLDEDFAEVVNTLIASIDSAALAFAQQQIEYITEVAQIPLTLSGDDIVIDTSGISETVELTSDNFSLDSTNLDLSLVMSTSMFTVDTSGLNLGTITPIATAGTPNLGTITPTVSLNTSSVTSAFSTLTTNVNNAISSFVSGLSETYAKLGIINIGGTGSFVSDATTFSGNQYSAGDYGASVKSGSNTSFADLTATYLQSGEEVYPYGIYFRYSGNSYAYYYETLSDANQVYNSYKDIFNPTKYGFRQGGLVPDPMDTIPAMLSPGEYILSPETVRRYGVSNLNRLNSGDSAAINATSDPEVKRLLAELIVAVRENETEVNVYTDMAGQTKAGIEEFRSELRERTRRQGEQYVPARYI